MSDAPVLRAMRPADLDFVEASWVESYRDGLLRHLRPAVEQSDYYAGQRRLIRQLLGVPACRGVVAAAPDYDEAILGWALAEPDVLHYVYVKDACRGAGIARAMLQALELRSSGFTYSHVTKRGKAAAAHYPGAKFNPWLLVR